MLVPRRWTGKTLTDHRADRAAVVRAVLTEAGVQMDDHDECSATATRADGAPRYVWSTVKPGDTDAPSYLRLIAAAIRTNAGAPNTKPPKNGPAHPAWIFRQLIHPA